MKRLLSFLFIPFWGLTACSNWLDIVPEEDIETIDSKFETRSNADHWLQSCYLFLQEPIPTLTKNPAFLGSDELVYGDYTRNMVDQEWYCGVGIGTGLQNSLDPYGDIWSKKKIDGRNGSLGRTDFYTAINLCNIFIEKIDQVYNMENAEKREWKAEVQALKAYYYFELVRHYGPIFLVPYNLDPNLPVSQMKVPRSPVDSCFQAIVNLCDEAAAELPPFNMKKTNRRCYFNKEAALALKARALLYQASDLFNGNPDYSTFTNKEGIQLFSTTKDKEKWRRAAEAAEEAITVCLENGKKLVDDQNASTPLQTTMLNIEASTQTFNYSSDEALLIIKHNGNTFYPLSLPNLESDPNHLLGGTVIAPSMKMVEMFYTENGLPINQDPSYPVGNIYTLTKETDPKYTDVVVMNKDILTLHTRREPRFYANIAADRCYWRLGKDVDDLRIVEACQGEDFGLKNTRINSVERQNLSGYWMKKWSCSKADLFNYNSTYGAMGDDPYPVIRLAELYLIAAEAWNEYLDVPDARVWDNLDVIRKRAGIPKVRESWAMARDKSKVNTKIGMRDIIRQEWNIEFAFEGMRFWNMRRWKTANVEMNTKLYGWNVVGNTQEKFYNNGKGPIVVQSSNKFVAPRDYFWPIRSEEISISGCKQNPGW